MTYFAVATISDQYGLDGIAASGTQEHIARLFKGVMREVQGPDREDR
jgi:hypothetical protein